MSPVVDIGRHPPVPVPPSGGAPALSLTGLHVETAAGRAIVDGVDLDLGKSRILGIVGESGSGKTTTARALLGFVQGGARITGGVLEIGGETVDLTDPQRARTARGRLIAYVPQHPASSMNPAMRIHALIEEMATAHGKPRPARTSVAGVLRSVGLPSDEAFLRRFPHQLSGGQIQRVAIAIVLMAKPAVIVLDEPTTGLDVLSQAQVLGQLKHLRDALGISLICVSHDLAVLSEIADDIAVMYAGKTVERGPAGAVLDAPRHAYTRRLLAAVPDPGKVRAGSAQADAAFLAVSGLSVDRRSGGQARRTVDDVSFGLGRGRCLALVGVSGSGKTTIARTIIGLQRASGGTVRLDGERLDADVRKRSREQRRRIQLVPQDSLDALNPRQTAGQAIARPLELFRGLRGRRIDDEIRRLLALVRLPPDIAARYPATLSGGERQRVSIARALAAAPDVIVCDEITSALDVSVQASILQLLDELKQATQVSFLFITHDLAVVAEIADDVLVLDSGRVAEYGPAGRVLDSPSSAYTRALLEAAPRFSLVRRGGARSRDNQRKETHL